MKEEAQNNILTKPLVVCAVACLSCLLWGSAIPLIKVGFAWFQIAERDYASKLLFAGYRFALAGLFTLLGAFLFTRRSPLPQRASLKNIGKLALVQTVIQYVFMYIGLAHTEGVRSSVLNGTSSLFAILIACFFLRTEPFTKAKALGCVLGPIGILVMNLGGSAGGNTALLGDILVLMAALSYAMSSCLLKRYSSHESPVLLSGWQFFLGGLILVVIGFLMGGTITVWGTREILLFLYLAALSAVAYSIWGLLLKVNPVSSVTVYGFMIPVFGVLLSGILLGENAFNLYILSALLLISLSIIVINYADFRKTPQNNTAPAEAPTLKGD